MLRLDVAQDGMESWGLLSVIGDDSNTASNCFSYCAILCHLGQTNPFTKFLALISHDQVNIAFSAKSLDKLGVLVIVAILGQNAKTCSTTIKCLGTLVETTTKSIVNKGGLEHLLECINSAELSTGLCSFNVFDNV